MTRPVSEHIMWGEPTTECPNCASDGEEVDHEDESHWTVAYGYKCDNCGCEWWWSQAECSHGLSGWELTVENWGDIRKRDGLADYYKRADEFSLSKSPTPCEFNTCIMRDDAIAHDFGEEHYCQDCTRNPEVQEELEEAAELWDE